MLLTLARMWATLETGEFVAKDAADEWAIERLDEAGENEAAAGEGMAAEALRIARAGYRGDADDRWEERGSLAAAASATLAARVLG